ncbi:YdiU family protein [Parasulfuritortus cantonensis]|uniref:Protein nucleotidyltransferase YdiU n=1 Tax=Parasulfuritortus cantonensis TaxID=2528202 RepID=A0A4R1B919_9PROT|nr:YdiU family protein [Parasulfuritortus cantonensis]TCJ12949.1 YdiU family protein [Parasulfuritortus cantonensis]
MPGPAIPFDNTYARDLAGFYEPCQPATVPAPDLLFFNRGLAEELRLGLGACDADALAAMFSGNALPEGAQPIAQAYAGHQFGQFNPQLGDGRALLIGEVVDGQGRRRDIALKGSGRTPFSRRGDGKAAVGPMLREVLIGEAMHALGIPTTRALAVVATGEPVRRERSLPGAVLTRIAASHLRVGTFQFFMAHGTPAMVRQLADYAIARHYPELAAGEGRYLGFLRAVAERQAALIAQWMHVGFIHGVMNTDNMGIPGETIDYGPCAFMEAYDPQAVFSSIDEWGRYAYEAQPSIARWNLARLAEALLPLIAANEGAAVEQATEVLDGFPARYHAHWLAGLRAKLGLAGQVADGDDLDTALGESWLDLLHAQQVDFTLGWRRLADAAAGDEAPLRALFAGQPGLERWLERWRARCAAEDAGAAAPAGRAGRMRRVNPWLIPRNHRVEEALASASDDGDLGPFERLLKALQRPYDEDPAQAAYAEPAPREFMSEFRTFCGT